MKRLLSAFNLGDCYEIEARILPAALVVVPAIVLVLDLELSEQRWLHAVGLGLGLEVFLAVAVSKVAHGFGRRLEATLVREWGGLPTERWLMPDDKTHSEQQKAKWRATLTRLSGLDLNVALRSGDLDEYSRLVRDAVAATRQELREGPTVYLLKRHNAGYGFARNAAGMRWLAVGVSGAVAACSAVLCVAEKASLGVLLLSVVFLLVAVGHSIVARSYVRYCAERYAETFFAAASNLADARNERTTSSNAVND
jgi:hypothetical protein